MERKNTDYSNSAVKLTNPPEIKELILKYREEQNQIKVLEEQIQSLIPQELKDRLEIANKYLSETNGNIRKAIDELGSFQDIEAGYYAIKQKRESITYIPELVRQYAPSKVASFVLIESVDVKGMEAMIKTGQITQEDSKKCGEVKETYAYIIK